MRSSEFESQQLQEVDIKKALGTAAVAAGMGLGGLAYNHMNKPAPAPAAVQKAPEPKLDLRSMNTNQVVEYIRERTKMMRWKPNEFEQFMAQVMHETHNLRDMSENLYYTTPQVVWKNFTSAFRKNPQAINSYLKNPQALANRVYANRMGNGDETSGDGWRYRGRGLLHITGKDMYARVGQGIGVDLVRNPDLLATDPDVSLRAALWYWRNIVHPKMQGKKFQDTRAVTKAINPAQAGLQSRKEKFQQQPKQP